MASSSARAPCRFFAAGTCQHSSDACRFSHDPELCRPGVIEEPCVHFMQGFCRSGDRCLFVHDREARDAKLLPRRKEPPAQRALKPVIQMYDRPKAAPAAAPAAQQSKQQKQQHGEHHEELEDGSGAVSQEQFHAQLAQDEQMYFYGVLPEEGSATGAAAAEKQAAAPQADWGKLAREAAAAGMTPEQMLLWQQQQRAEARRLAEKQASMPPCKFFQQGKCHFGADCRFSHAPAGAAAGAAGKEPEDALTALERKASAGLECGVCLDNVLGPNGTGRFGLLTGCNHSFCLKCIREWRGGEMAHTSTTKELVRRCPLCRAASHFIVPSDRMVRDPERKRALVLDYMDGMRSIHCKHFDRGQGKCPFGTSCFYKHVYANGKEQDPGELRTFTDQEGKMRVDAAAVPLAEFFDKATRLAPRRQ